MNLITYLIAYPFIFVLSRLPLKVSYILSDIVFFILYYIVGYRRQVIRDNLKIAFPKKNKAEYTIIEKQFYHHLCDFIIEMIHLSKISKENLLKRVHITNPEVLKTYEKSGKSVLYLSGHYCNWEWLGVLNYYIHAKSYAVYTQIQNKYFDRLIKKIRERCGAVLFEKSKATGIITSNNRENIAAHYVFVSDQSPMIHQRRNYWRTFFNVPVPCFTGYDFLARSTDMAVIFVNMKKIKRGYYTCSLELITDSGKKESENTIIDKFYDMLEEQIRNEPSYYLWTHKRWKHSHHAEKIKSPKP